MTHEALTSAEREVLARIDHLLGDRAVWEPADSGLPARVTATIDAERAPVASRSLRRWLALAGAAALSAVAASAVARPGEATPGSA